MHLEHLAAHPVLELPGRSRSNHPSVVNDHDLVAQAVRFLQVLRREKHGRAVRDQAADHPPQLLAAVGVEAGGRLVQIQEAGLPTRLAARSSRRRIPPEYVFTVLRRRVGQIEGGEKLTGPMAGLRSPQPDQAADHVQVLVAGQELVDGGVLSGQPDQPTHFARLAYDVEAPNRGPPRVRPQQRR
jgi:hypothetical protein